MTKKQIEQFNRMRLALRKISKQYRTYESIKRSAGKDYGLDYTEALEMSYENIQGEAEIAVRGVREIAVIKEQTP